MSVLQQLMKELSGTQKAVSSTPNAQLGYGNGGLFNFPGLERTLVNAAVLPDMGLVSRLPSVTSRSTNPLFGLVTGVTATTGSEPTGVCDPFPEAGLMKLCTTSFVWGRFGRSSRVYDADSIGQVTDRGIMDDYQILGGPSQDNAFVPDNLGGGNLARALRAEADKMRFELAVAWGRDFSRIAYTGNPTNNTSGGGYKEPYGLSILINDNYRDAETGVACPAADSLVRSFGDANVATNGTSIVRTLTYMWRYVRSIARRTGLDPVTWGIVMREELFYELTAVWPCAYMTYLCNTGTFSTSDVRMTDSGDIVAMRDAMREGRYLLIDGRQVEVIFDEAVPETAVGSGVFESDIYIVPLRILGNTPATYIEYKQYDAADGPLAFAQAMAPGGVFFTTNGGRFLWYKDNTGFCVQVAGKTEWRIVLRTPHLAARLTDVRYTPLIAMRDAFPDEPYYVNGGTTSSTSRYAPSYYSPTA